MYASLRDFEIVHYTSLLPEALVERLVRHRTYNTSRVFKPRSSPLTSPTRKRTKKADRKLGRAFWEKVLAGHREYEAGRKNRSKNNDKPVDDDERQQPLAFCFLDLPAKIRNAVYMIYLEGAKDIETGNDIRRKRREKIRLLPPSLPPPTPYAREEERLRTNLQRRLSHSGGKRGR